MATWRRPPIGARLATVAESQHGYFTRARVVREGVSDMVLQRTVTIMECRPPWRPEYGPGWTRFPVARLRYTKTRGEWSLYWRDRNLRFHEYDLVDPTPHVDDLIAEIESDPAAILWG